MGNVILTDDLLTGIDDIDNQHRTLYNWANYVLSEDPTGSASVAQDAMMFLVGYVRYHFAAEEFAMNQMGYSGANQHAGQHRILRDKVISLRDQFRGLGNTPELRENLYRFMQDWLALHIGRMDKDMADFVKEPHNSTPWGMLPEPETLVQAGFRLSEADLAGIRLVRAPGEIPISEIRARQRALSAA